jgi:hypothetical protein
MSNALSAGKAWASTGLVQILTGVLFSAVVSAEPRVTHIFRAPADFQGQVQRVIIDRGGVPWISTTRSLYKAAPHGGIIDVEPVGGTDERIVMMPGGDLYARVSADKKSGRFVVQLRNLNTPGQVIGSLDSPGLPVGFTTLHVGYRGRMIVTATPLQNAEGLRGKFQFAYWSRAGDLLSEIKLDGPHTAVVDESGDAILLMGQADAISFDNSGTELWRLRGAFRKGALAGRGSVALLNPADAIDTIRVVRPGAVTTVTLPGPVHELALTPDGSMAAIATDAGKVSFITTGSCGPSSCPVVEMPALHTGTYYVSAVRFLDRATLAVGVIEASGDPSDMRYDEGDVFVVATDGQVKLRHPVRLAADAGWSPLLNVKFGEAVFTAHTSDTVVVINVN